MTAGAPNTTTHAPEGSVLPAQPGSLRPPPIPSGRTYLGAWVNPGHLGGDSASIELEQLPTVQSAVGRLGILHVYAGWEAPAPVQGLQRIAATGAVPLLDWACGPDAQILDGSQDSLIGTYAAALKGFGRPVFLRYAWEMNLNSQRNQRCQNAGGPSGFVAAWRHIVDIFRHAGAGNVAFVWCPGTANTNWRPYYPGRDALDWIGADGYNRDPDPASAPTAFSRVFGTFYNEFAGEAKPIMVAETGALADAQAAYLSSLATVLPRRFPDVRALVYFDAPGPRGDWSLGGKGLRAFASLARNAYFSYTAEVTTP